MASSLPRLAGAPEGRWAVRRGVLIWHVLVWPRDLACELSQIEDDFGVAQRMPPPLAAVWDRLSCPDGGGPEGFELDCLGWQAEIASYESEYAPSMGLFDDYDFTFFVVRSGLADWRQARIRAALFLGAWYVAPGRAELGREVALQAWRLFLRLPVQTSEEAEAYAHWTLASARNDPLGLDGWGAYQRYTPLGLFETPTQQREAVRPYRIGALVLVGVLRGEALADDYWLALEHRIVCSGRWQIQGLYP